MTKRADSEVDKLNEKSLFMQLNELKLHGIVGETPNEGSKIHRFSLDGTSIRKIQNLVNQEKQAVKAEVLDELEKKAMETIHIDGIRRKAVPLSAIKELRLK